MFALPILARELRSRARKPGTAWVRVLVGLLATVVALSILTWGQQVVWNPSLPGKLLFDSLSSILFVFCLVEGVRQTADCLSQEKREGTLGLLFLTDLSGRDVVIGKLAATSLGSCYALLAAFPILAFALPAGGVTAGEFWRTVLVLLNTLFAGLAWGMWTSAQQRVEGRALLHGLGNAFAFALVPWIFEILLRPLGLPNISLSVAMHLAEDAAYSGQAARFWMTLGLAHALSWLLLARAGRIVETGWREETPITADPATQVAYVPGWPGANQQPPRIQEYWPARMTDDPAGWLARRQLRHGGLIWLCLVTMAVGPYLILLFLRFLPVASLSGLYTAINLSSEFLPAGLLLFIASRCFAEARRGGEMEMILSTPLAAREIVLGQWRALWQRLRTAFIVTAALIGFLMLVFLFGFDWSSGNIHPYVLLQAAQSTQRLLCGLASCWLGLYLGLKMESQLRAVGYGVLALIVGPWLVSTLLWMLIRPLFAASFTGVAWYWVVQWFLTGLGCLYLGGVIWWSRRELIQRLRELAARC